MTLEGLVRTIRKRTKGRSWAAQQLVLSWLEGNRARESDELAACVDLIERIDGLLPERPQEPEPVRSVVASTPASAVLTADRVRLIEPVIRRLRVQVFGDPTPPFATYADAVKWYDGQDWTQRFPRFPTDREDWRVFVFHHPEAGILPLPVHAGSSMGVIAILVRHLYVATGFAASDLVRFVLTGQKPTLPRVRVLSRSSVHNLEKIWREVPKDESVDMDSEPLGKVTRRQLTIEINTPDLKRDELWRIYQEIRKRWATGSRTPVGRGQRRARRVTPLDQKLLLIMQRLKLDGQRKHPVATWKRVYGRWTQANGPDTNHPEATLRRRWERIWDHKRDLVGMGGP